MCIHLPILQIGRGRSFISQDSSEPGYLAGCLYLDPFGVPWFAQYYPLFGHPMASAVTKSMIAGDIRLNWGTVMRGALGMHTGGPGRSKRDLAKCVSRPHRWTKRHWDDGHWPICRHWDKRWTNRQSIWVAPLELGKSNAPTHCPFFV